jgi:hypothetical protein
VEHIVSEPDRLPGPRDTNITGHVNEPNEILAIEVRGKVGGRLGETSGANLLRANPKTKPTITGEQLLGVPKSTELQRLVDGVIMGRGEGIGVFDPSVGKVLAEGRGDAGGTGGDRTLEERTGAVDVGGEDRIDMGGASKEIGTTKDENRPAGVDRNPEDGTARDIVGHTSDDVIPQVVDGEIREDLQKVREEDTRMSGRGGDDRGAESRIPARRGAEARSRRDTAQQGQLLQTQIPRSTERNTPGGRRVALDKQEE